jgi:hypothetical protein
VWCSCCVCCVDGAFECACALVGAAAWLPPRLVAAAACSCCESLGGGCVECVAVSAADGVCSASASCSSSCVFCLSAASDSSGAGSFPDSSPIASSAARCPVSPVPFSFGLQPRHTTSTDRHRQTGGQTGKQQMRGRDSSVSHHTGAPPISCIARTRAAAASSSRCVPCRPRQLEGQGGHAHLMIRLRCLLRPQTASGQRRRSSLFPRPTCGAVAACAAWTARSSVHVHW